MHAHQQFVAGDKSLQLEPIHVTLRNGCRYLGKSKSWMYGKIAQGKVEAVKEGSSTMLVFESLKRLAAARPPAVIGKGNPKFRELRKLVTRRHRKRKANPTGKANR
jgi:hypothetical protein